MVNSLPTEVVLHSILCEDDYEDEEALRESIADIKALAEQYGVVVYSRGIYVW